MDGMRITAPQPPLHVRVAMAREAARIERRARRDADLRRIETRAAAATSTPATPPCPNCGFARCIRNGRCDYCGQIQVRNGVHIRGAQVRAAANAPTGTPHPPRTNADRDLHERAQYAGCRIEHAANIGAILEVRW